MLIYRKPDPSTLRLARLGTLTYSTHHTTGIFRMRWLLHEAVFDGRLNEMLSAVDSRGDEAVILSGRKPKVPEADGKPTFAFVSVQVARLIHGRGDLSPGVFWSPTAFNRTSWMTWLGRWALNTDMVWMPWSELIRRGPDQWRGISVDGRIFVCPDSGQKVFSGQELSLDNFAVDVKAIEATSSVMPNTLVGVCRSKPIDGDVEWRVWISGAKVIASSPYSWRDDIQLAPMPTAVMELAQEIAVWTADERNWAPDRAFVSDFCMSSGVPRMIEVNSISSSGVYHADLAAILDGVAEAVEAEMSIDL